MKQQQQQPKPIELTGTAAATTAAAAATSAPNPIALAGNAVPKEETRAFVIDAIKTMALVSASRT